MRDEFRAYSQLQLIVRGKASGVRVILPVVTRFDRLSFDGRRDFALTAPVWLNADVVEKCMLQIQEKAIGRARVTEEAGYTPSLPCLTYKRKWPPKKDGLSLC